MVLGSGPEPRHRAGGFLYGSDYFWRQETREQGGNDRIRLGEICFPRGHDRFHDGHHCLVDTNDRVESEPDRVQAINNWVAFRNDRRRTGND